MVYRNFPLVCRFTCSWQWASHLPDRRWREPVKAHSLLKIHFTFQVYFMLSPVRLKKIKIITYNFSWIVCNLLSPKSSVFCEPALHPVSWHSSRPWTWQWREGSTTPWQGEDTQSLAVAGLSPAHMQILYLAARQHKSFTLGTFVTQHSSFPNTASIVSWQHKEWWEGQEGRVYCILLLI